MAKVIIEYEAQAASLKAVTDTIINANKQIGDSAELAAKEGADAYKAMGKAMGAAFSSQEVSKAINSNIANINKNRDALTKITGESIKFSKAAISLGKVVKENAFETLKAKEALAKYQKTLTDTQKGTDTTEKKTQSLKGRLRELKEELSKLETAGLEGTQAFEKLAVEAGKLQDQIGDTTERVKVLASDTFKFDAALGAAKGLAAGFAVAQGAAALFGAENEELNKTIARTQGALALLSGLQEIATLVTGQGATKIALQNIFMKEKVVVTNAATGSVAALTTAEEGAAVATLATKKSLDLLKISIAATGIGALVLVLGALYQVYQQNAAASKKFNDLIAEQEKLNKAATDEIRKQTQERTELNDKLLVSGGKLTQQEADRRKIQRDAQEEIKSQLKPQVEQREKLIEQEATITREIEAKQKAIDLATKSTREGAALSISTNQAAIRDLEKQKETTTKALGEVKANIANIKTEISTTAQASINIIDTDAAKENAAKIKDINDKLIEDRLKAELNGLKRLEIVDGESTQNKIDQAKKQAEIDKANAKSSIDNAKLRASTILLIDAQLAQSVEQIRLDATNKAIENEVKILEAKKVTGTATIEDEISSANKTFEIEKNKLQALINLNKASFADLELLNANHEKKVTDIKNKGIQEQYNLRVQAFELQKMLGVTTLQDELSLIRARAEAELKANESSGASVAVKEANRKAIIAKTDNDITQAKAIEANKRIDIDNAEAQAALTLGEATYEQRVKLIEDEGIKAQNSLDKKLLGEEAYNAAVLKINADTTAKLKNEQDLRVQAVFEYINAVSSVFSEINDLTKQQSELRIESINSVSKVELDAINNSVGLETDKLRKRASLELRTQRLIAAEKRKQAEQDKALALFQAIVGSASAVAAAKTIPLKIIIAAAGAIQIAAIVSRPIPKFEKGGVVGGKRHSQGGTIVEAEQGEYIVNRKQTSTHRRELNALNQSSEAFKKLINERYVRPALMNYMLNSKSKEMGVNVNATLNSKTMEAELKGLRKDLRQSKKRFNNSIDSRYQWQ